MSEPKDLLLLVWVHGFKGNEVTFESFPDRISHLLQSTHPSLKIESRVFPAYQTRGELHAATLAFVDWLTTLVVELENGHGNGGGAGKAKIVLMGHSMGGLLIADAARDIAANTREGDAIWPHVVAIMAFDTPYLGLHPHTFKHSLSTAAGYYEQAKNIASAAGVLSPLAIGLGMGKWGKSSEGESSQSAGPSKSSSRTSSPGAGTKDKGKAPATDAPPAATSVAGLWNSTKTLYGLGAVALGAAAVGTAYYRREDFVNGWKFGYEHMTFVRNLWDEEAMKNRLLELHELDKSRSIRFYNFYTHIPPSPPGNLVPRTFCILPPMTHPLYPKWSPATNTLAQDEISAHMGMFNPKTNDGFYDLGLVVVKGIGERVEEEGVRVIGETEVKKALEGWREEKVGEKVIWVEE